MFFKNDGFGIKYHPRVDMPLNKETKLLFFPFPYFTPKLFCFFCIRLLCDTMWVVRQVDYLFVCFGAKPKQRAWARISRETEVDEERKVREKTEGESIK